MQLGYSYFQMLHDRAGYWHDRTGFGMRGRGSNVA